MKKVDEQHKQGGTPRDYLLYHNTVKHDYLPLPILNLEKQKSVPPLLQAISDHTQGVYEVTRNQNEAKFVETIEEINSTGYCSFLIFGEGDVPYIVALGSPSGNVIYWRPRSKNEKNFLSVDWSDLPEMIVNVLRCPQVIKIQSDPFPMAAFMQSTGREVNSIVNLDLLFKYTDIGKKEISYKAMIHDYLREICHYGPTHRFNWTQLQTWPTETGIKKIFIHLVQKTRSPLIILYRIVEEIFRKPHATANQAGHLRQFLYQHVGIKWTPEEFQLSKTPAQCDLENTPKGPHAIREINLMRDSSVYFVRLRDFGLRIKDCETCPSHANGIEPETHARKQWTCDASKWDFLQITPHLDRWCLFCGEQIGRERTKEEHNECIRRGTQCRYRFCNTNATHRVIMCPTLHGVCGACGRRGHQPSDHTHYSPVQLDYIAYLYAFQGKLTSAVYLEVTPRKYEVTHVHWRNLPMNLSRNFQQQAFQILQLPYTEPTVLRNTHRKVLGNSLLKSPERIELCKKLKTQMERPILQATKRGRGRGRGPRGSHGEFYDAAGNVIGYAVPSWKGSQSSLNSGSSRGSRGQRGLRGPKAKRSRGTNRGYYENIIVECDPNNITIDVESEEKEQITLDAISSFFRKRKAESGTAQSEGFKKPAEVAKLVEQLVDQRRAHMIKAIPKDLSTPGERKVAAKMQHEVLRNDQMFKTIIPVVQDGFQDLEKKTQVIQGTSLEQEAQFRNILPTFLQLGQKMMEMMGAQKPHEGNLINLSQASEFYNALDKAQKNLNTSHAESYVDSDMDTLEAPKVPEDFHQENVAEASTQMAHMRTSTPIPSPTRFHRNPIRPSKITDEQLRQALAQTENARRIAASQKASTVSECPSRPPDGDVEDIICVDIEDQQGQYGVSTESQVHSGSSSGACATAQAKTIPTPPPECRMGPEVSEGQSIDDQNVELADSGETIEDLEHMPLDEDDKLE